MTSEKVRKSKSEKKPVGGMIYGVGAHEPIYHRLRTGNSTAEEWARWAYETSDENLDVLEKLGVQTALIACSKGFGLEFEKPLIERAAKFVERAARRGIRTHIYVQGYPVYYETFLLERPEAINWLGRKQNGDFIPWGSQTFRRFMDPTCLEFHDYEEMILTYILKQIKPEVVAMDNSFPPWCWSDSCRDSFRAYLRSKYTEQDAMREFGIPSFDAIDLPNFDPITFPPDAIRIVKDPVLQEWARWYSRVSSDFLGRMRGVVQRQSPGTEFHIGVGCEILRYNHLFNCGVDFDDRFKICDMLGTEESFWRPGVIENAPGGSMVVMDERTPDDKPVKVEATVRVSTDARWIKICTNYGKKMSGGFWGEVDRASKLVALAHYMAFTQDANHIGNIGPLAAAPQMFDDIRDVIDWGNAHLEVLTGRDARQTPVGVWRGTVTNGFVRHQPVWEACAVEQMLFERHVPFNILLDGVLEDFLAKGRVLIMPGTACVSDAQVAAITAFVERGGSLLLLTAAGTRDERTRLRRKYAFEHLFNGQVPNLEYFGPPHWVPELAFGNMPARLDAKFGKGRVVMLKEIQSRTVLDLTRDPYSPARQVMVKDVLPPANDDAIMVEVDSLLGDSFRVDAPITTLCEYWRRGNDLVVACANLRKGRDGGPVTLRLPASCKAKNVQVYTLLEKEVATLPVVKNAVKIGKLSHFAAFVVPGGAEK
jgi:hypothetical protein